MFLRAPRIERLVERARLLGEVVVPGTADEREGLPDPAQGARRASSGLFQSKKKKRKEKVSISLYIFFFFLQFFFLLPSFALSEK
jgi:hypothetical protein